MSNDSDEDLIRKWGPFMNSWVDIEKARREAWGAKKQAMKPEDWDSWKDWVEESARRQKQRDGGEYYPSA